MILPEVSLAEGLVFVEEVYSSIQSLKILNPNSRDLTVQNTDIHPSINQSINRVFFLIHILGVYRKMVRRYLNKLVQIKYVRV